MRLYCGRGMVARKNQRKLLQYYIDIAQGIIDLTLFDPTIESKILYVESIILCIAKPKIYLLERGDNSMCRTFTYPMIMDSVAIMKCIYNIIVAKECINV